MNMNIEMNLIHVDEEWNCRGRILLHDVHELSGLMRAHGQIQPVVLQPASRTEVPAGKQYRLIAGFRRFAAAKLLKWTTILAIVRDVDDDEAREINLIENLERKDLNVVQEAKAMERLYPREKHSMREIAKRLQRHTCWVQQRWDLLRLPDQVQQMFASGRLPLNQLDFVKHAPDVVAAAQEALKRKQAKLAAPQQQQPRRRRKSDVRKMIARLIDLGIEGLPTRVLAWCNGYISQSELDHDIEVALRTGR